MPPRCRTESLHAEAKPSLPCLNVPPNAPPRRMTRAPKSCSRVESPTTKTLLCRSSAHPPSTVSASSVQSRGSYVDGTRRACSCDVRPPRCAPQKKSSPPPCACAHSVEGSFDAHRPCKYRGHAPPAPLKQSGIRGPGPVAAIPRRISRLTSVRAQNCASWYALWTVHGGGVEWPSAMAAERQ